MNPIALLISSIESMERAIARDAAMIGALVEGLIAICRRA